MFYCSVLAAGIYGGFTFYPRVLFSGSCVYENISIYAHVPLTCDPEGVPSRISGAIAADAFFDPGQKFEIYLTGGYGEYRFFAPFCGKSYACLHPASNKVFVASADFDKNLAYGPELPGKRILENVIVHELVKAQLKNKLGPLKYAALQDWKKDGYADHVAKETEGENAPDICGGDKQKNPLAKYLEYRLVLETLKAGTEAPYTALILENNVYAGVRDRVIKKYCENHSR
jgi:hypothetical protein